MTDETKATPADKTTDPKTKEPKQPELSPEQSAAQIDSALEFATTAGIPSAAAYTALWKLANAFWKSGMFKSAGSAAGCFVKILYGQELGLTATQAMVNIDIIDGTPAMSAQLMTAKFKQCGGRIEVIERSDTKCTVRLHWHDDSDEFTWSVDDANKAGLRGKDNHRKYPRAMLYWRAVSEGIKVVAPEALLKAYTFGELTDDRTQDLAGYLTMDDKAEEFGSQPTGQPQQSKTNGSDKQFPSKYGSEDKPNYCEFCGQKHIVKGTIITAATNGKYGAVDCIGKQAEKSPAQTSRTQDDADLPFDQDGKARVTTGPVEPWIGEEYIKGKTVADLPGFNHYELRCIEAYFTDRLEMHEDSIRQDRVTHAGNAELDTVDRERLLALVKYLGKELQSTLATT